MNRLSESDKKLLRDNGWDIIYFEPLTNMKDISEAVEEGAFCVIEQLKAEKDTLLDVITLINK